MAKSRRKAGGCTRGRFRLKRLGKGWLAHRRLPVRETPRATLEDLAEIEAAMGPEKVITPKKPKAVKTVVPKVRKAAAKSTQKAITPKKATAKTAESKPAAKMPTDKKTAVKKPTPKTAGKKSPTKKPTPKTAGKKTSAKKSVAKKAGGAKGSTSSG